MDKRLVIVIVVFLGGVAFAGVQAGFFSPPEIIEQEPSFNQPNADSAGTAGTTQTPYSSTAATGEIVLRLSDLPSGYEFGGGVNQSQDANTDTGDQLESQGILRQHQRSFRYNGTETTQYPAILLSSVVVYENTDVADQQFQQAVANLTTQNATAETREVVSGSTATVVTFQNERDGYVVLVYSQTRNLGFYVATLSGDGYREEFTVEQYVKMLVDV
jgi:hypothetical protein